MLFFDRLALNLLEQGPSGQILAPGCRKPAWDDDDHANSRDAARHTPDNEKLSRDFHASILLYENLWHT